MDIKRKEFELQPFVKYVVLKIGLFECEIIDEANFALEDKASVMKFKRQYVYKDDCFVVKVDM